MMRALLLAAGTGSRLRPLTEVVPKCLVPINGTPLLGIWLERLFGAGIEEVCVNLHFKSNFVKDFLLSSPYRDRIHIVYEEQLLGTGGTLLANQDFFKNDDSLMLIHADNLSIFSVDDFIASHRVRPSGVDISMMTFETDNPQSCGIVETNTRGIVTGFYEKVKFPPSNKANGAVYIFNNSIFDFLRDLNKSYIDISTEVLPKFLNKIQIFDKVIYHRDIGQIDSYLKAHQECNYTSNYKHNGIWWRSYNGSFIEDFFAKVQESTKMKAILVASLNNLKQEDNLIVIHNVAKGFNAHLYFIKNNKTVLAISNEIE